MGKGSKKVETFKPDRSGVVDVDAKLLMAAHRCVSTEEVRYYLNGVRVQSHPAGGVLLIGCDGHRMMVIRDDTGWCRKPVIIQIDRAGLNACKPSKLQPTPRVVVDKAGMARIGTYASVKTVLIDGTYPDWGGCVPVNTWKTFDTASFNGGYLGEFGKISEILGSTTGCLRVMVAGPGDPALVLFPHESQAFGVLMPMRADVPPGGLPIWMKPVMDARAKAKPVAKPKPKARKKK